MTKSPLTEHYAQLIGLRSTWEVTEVELSHADEEVRIYAALRPGTRLHCPVCDGVRPGYDTRERRWRHLDTMQYRTVLIARVPRVDCEQHGIRLILVPWADPSSRFTALFEALVIDWLLEASFSAVARKLRLSWDEVDGIQSRAVRRGLARRKRRAPERIGVDETSFQKRHEYVTLVNDLTEGVVLMII